MQSIHSESIWNRASRDWWKTRKGSLFPSIWTGLAGLVFLGFYKSWQAAEDEVDYFLAFAVPAVVWALGAFVFHLWRAPFRQRDEARRAYSKAKNALDLRSVRNAAVKELSDLYSEGRDLRNKPTRSDDQVTQWIREVDAWTDIVKTSLAKHDLHCYLPVFENGVGSAAAKSNESFGFTGTQRETNARKCVEEYLDNLAGITRSVGETVQR